MIKESRRRIQKNNLVYGKCHEKTDLIKKPGYGYAPTICQYWDITTFLKTTGWVKGYLNPVVLKN
jgi:hypothetical protein